MSEEQPSMKSMRLFQPLFAWVVLEHEGLLGC